MHRWGFAYLFIRCGPSAGLRRVNKVTRKTRPYTNPQSKKRSFSEKVTDRLSKEFDRGSATKNVNERTTSPIRVIYLPTDRPSDGHTLLEPLCERLKCIFSQTVCLRVCVLCIHLTHRALLNLWWLFAVCFALRRLLASFFGDRLYPRDWPNYL